jgi:hypothetical protein
LRWTAFAVAAAPAGAAVLTPRRASAGTGAAIAPANLELVTLAEDRAVITWYTGYAGSDDGLGRMEPAPSDAEVRWGTDPTRLDQVAAGRRTDTPYHWVELTGLEPGRTYYYEARSAGQLVAPTAFSLIDGNAVSTDTGAATGTGPFRFTAPAAPAGDFLFSIVLCNDLHVGETVAGLVGGLGLEGVSQVPGERPYPEIMMESLVADVRAQGAAYLLAAGDITAEAEPVDLARARELLDGFGDRHQDWYAARGNHDRAHEGEAYASCQVGRWQGNDCFRDTFFPDDEPTWFSQEVNGLRIIGLDTYDKPGDGGDAGALGDEQLEWFLDELRSDPDQPTVVFGHHPLVVQDSPYPITPGTALDAAQAETIIAAYAEAPGVFLHHAGHTHRNKLTELPGAPGVTHQEVAAVKEYPGGATVLRLHTGGYALNFAKASSEDALAWSERSRMQIAGTWPQFSLGSRVADRNLVVERDLSGLTAVPASPAAAASSAAGATATSPATGTGSDDDPPVAALAVGGVVALSAIAGATLAVRRRRSSPPPSPPEQPTPEQPTPPVPSPQR